MELSRDNPDQNEVIKKKNEIRQVLTKFFTERDCQVLFRPVSDEKKLRDVNSLPYETLRPQFRYQVEDLIKKVFLNLKPKVIDGQTING